METRILLLVPLILFSCSACTLFFGTIRPTEVKSTDYRVLDLSKNDLRWLRLDSQLTGNIGNGNQPVGNPSGGVGGNDTGVSDMVFQEQQSNSVISISSACKNYQEGITRDNLQVLTQELLLGISEKEIEEAKPVTIAQTSGWEVTLRGTMNSQKVMLKTIVLKKANCIYDLVYVAKPEFFKKDEPAFSRFVSSFQLK